MSFESDLEVLKIRQAAAPVFDRERMLACRQATLGNLLDPALRQHYQIEASTERSDHLEVVASCSFQGYRVLLYLGNVPDTYAFMWRSSAAGYHERYVSALARPCQVQALFLSICAQILKEQQLSEPQ